MKMGKGKGEKKNKRDSRLNGLRGDFGPVRPRAAARTAGPDGPRVRRQRGRAQG
jgi:hypothetical protein